MFIILGIAVNCGGNTSHQYIGGKNWHIGDAPFVNGIGGFASVFVTASFAYGGTESIAITAGETKDPARTLPKVVRNVFWRILLVSRPPYNVAPIVIFTRMIAVLHSLRPHHWPKCSLQLPGTSRQDKPYLSIHNRLHDGRLKRRRILHQRCSHDLSHLSR